MCLFLDWQNVDAGDQQVSNISETVYNNQPGTTALLVEGTGAWTELSRLEPAADPGFGEEGSSGSLGTEVPQWNPGAEPR